MEDDELKNINTATPERRPKIPALCLMPTTRVVQSYDPPRKGSSAARALNAMEEQTDQQLEQIKKQIELLAEQAREIQLRKEISYTIYNSKMSFQPVIGKEYFLYEKEDESYLLSMIGPDEWGRSQPYKRFVARVKLAADHTWIVLN